MTNTPPRRLRGQNKKPRPLLAIVTRGRKEDTMTHQEKINAVKRAAKRRHISGGELSAGYWYGENPYSDMLIENALYCDMFPEDIPDNRNYHGFNRTLYSLSRAE